MVTPHGWDYALLLLGAAILGAIGGFAAELMPTRGKVTGAIAWPRRRKGPPRLTEFGWIGSVILGAIAGVATDVTADVGSRSKARADRAHTVIAAVTPTPPLA